MHLLKYNVSLTIHILERMTVGAQSPGMRIVSSTALGISGPDPGHNTDEGVSLLGNVLP